MKINSVISWLVVDYILFMLFNKKGWQKVNKALLKKGFIVLYALLSELHIIIQVHLSISYCFLNGKLQIASPSLFKFLELIFS